MYNEKLKSFQMNEFKPEISKGVILTTDIDRITEKLEKCPHSYYNPGDGIFCILCPTLLVIGGCKF